MTALDESAPVLYQERTSWWPLLWGPVGGLVGVAVEALTPPGPVNLAMWLLFACAATAATAVWLYARRRLCSVRLTATTLTAGREQVPVSEITEVADVGAPVGARVLGGGWTPPKGTTAVPLRVSGDQVVLAWARDPQALTEALQSLDRG